MQLWILLWGQGGFLEGEYLDKGEGKDQQEGATGKKKPEELGPCLG